MIIFVCMHDITFHGIKPQFPREHAPASDHEQLPVQTGKRTNSSERIIFVWRLFAPNTTCEKPRNWFWFIFQERNGKRWRPVNGLPVSRRRRSCDWSTCRLDRCRVSQKKLCFLKWSQERMLIFLRHRVCLFANQTNYSKCLFLSRLLKDPIIMEWGVTR